jgi:hypothetical protein
MKQVSLASYHFIPLRCKYSPQHPFFKYLQSLFFPSCQISITHPYKTTDKIIVQHIILHFYTADKIIKGSELNDSKHYPSLNNSKFPNESKFGLLLSTQTLNSGTFSKHILAIFLLCYTALPNIHLHESRNHKKAIVIIYRIFSNLIRT